VIGATNQDEANIVGSLYAKSLGVTRAAAVVTHDGYARIAGSLGVDVPVSLKNCMSNAIVGLFRGDAIRTIHSVSGSNVSIVELRVSRANDLIGVPLKIAKLPKDTLVMSISRDATEFIPSGDDAIHEGDVIVLMTTSAHETSLIKRFCAPT
ncbi:MAG: hypothetical protein EA426_14665, partial [Spirochaetaceae bacterium]